jgi:hypothetical protein
MSDQDILEELDQHSVTDDFGYIVFHSDDDLLNFAYAILAKAEQYERIGNHEM